MKRKGTLKYVDKEINLDFEYVQFGNSKSL